MRSAVYAALICSIAAPAIACDNDAKQRLIFDSVINGENYVAPPVPESIPETTFLRGDGEIGYPTDYRGKPAIITLWHPDCPGCKIEEPVLNEISAIDINFDETAAIFHENCLVATPTHLVLDASGNVSEILMGPQPWTSKSARKYIESLISGS